jgi:hypothetical protein
MKHALTAFAELGEGLRESNRVLIASDFDGTLCPITVRPSNLSPSRRPMTEAMPAPTWTDGPSRPSAMPVANETEHRPNFPRTVRRLMRPSRRKSAALV